MKNYLFDASSIILLIKKFPEIALSFLEQEFFLDLTIYEIGNAEWKINRLFNKSDKSTVLEAITQVYYITAMMETLKTDTLKDLTATMEIAFDSNLSFYDSAYVYSSKQNQVILVTEDVQLQKIAKEHGITCIKVEDLISKQKRFTTVT